MASDLEILKNRVDNIDGYPIRTEATAISVVAIVGLPSEFIKTKVIPQHIKHNNVAIWCGDASAMAVCAYSCSGAEKFHFIGQLTKDERKTSSGQRELLTVKYALTKWLSEKSTTKETTTMHWLTDSENLVTFLTRGSWKPHIQEIVLDILDLCRELNLAIMPIHLGREDPRIKIADAGSKAPDSDDWSIDKVSFQNLSQKFGPFTIDLFAEEANYRVPRFYSSFMTLSSEGVNAFCHSWDNEEALICPPVNKIIGVFRKIKLTKGWGYSSYLNGQH